MDPSSFKEIGSFAVVVAPVVAGAIWLVQKQFAWFTTTLTAEQAERAKLTQQLIDLIQKTMADHTEHARRIAELEQRNTQEHEAIMSCIQQTRSVP